MRRAIRNYSHREVGRSGRRLQGRPDQQRFRCEVVDQGLQFGKCSGAQCCPDTFLVLGDVQPTVRIGGVEQIDHLGAIGIRGAHLRIDTAERAVHGPSLLNVATPADFTAPGEGRPTDEQGFARSWTVYMPYWPVDTGCA